MSQYYIPLCVLCLNSFFLSSNLIKSKNETINEINSIFIHLFIYLYLYSDNTVMRSISLFLFVVWPFSLYLFFIFILKNIVAIKTKLIEIQNYFSLFLKDFKERPPFTISS